MSALRESGKNAGSTDVPPDLDPSALYVRTRQMSLEDLWALLRENDVHTVCTLSVEQSSRLIESILIRAPVFPILLRETKRKKIEIGWGRNFVGALYRHCGPDAIRLEGWQFLRLGKRNRLFFYRLPADVRYRFWKRIEVLVYILQEGSGPKECAEIIRRWNDWSDPPKALFGIPVVYDEDLII